jgi:hypothetical protein
MTELYTALVALVIVGALVVLLHDLFHRRHP